MIAAPAIVAPRLDLGRLRERRTYEAWERKDTQWAGGLVQSLPLSWAGRLIERWRVGRTVDPAAANLAHLRQCQVIGQAQRAGLSPDANDHQLCEEAGQSARDMGRRVDQRRTITPADWPEGVRLLAQWAEVDYWLESRGLQDAARRLLAMRARGACVLARVRCDRWWRRLLRRVHARAVEATARAIGLVHKRAGCYVSDEGAKHRRGQLARNARALESVEAVNETGQAYTLAELAAKGPGNREIRRHELMTRIAGFELIARESGHDAVFATVTCPSRMHAMRTAGPGVEANPRFDGTTPDEAQRYLAAQWAKCRAAAARAGVEWYGFRIAEPNHDGTPHWHLLLFVPSVERKGIAARRPGYRAAVRLLRRYFLWTGHQSDELEPGARRHRVTVERIDWARGSAAGYVAKYVAKNIDGYRVEKDLYGNDAMTASQRVDAWASRWRIRQFQQLGGAPVTVWRELRRLHPEQEQASPSFCLALEAVNIAAGAKDHASEAVQRYTAAHGWATYTHIQGGPSVKRRSLRLQLLRDQTGELGRYGDLQPARVVGVQRTEILETRRPAFGIIPAAVVRTETRVEVESERSTWTIVPRGQAPARGEAVRPWSPVNNCTGRPVASPAPDPLFLAFAGIKRCAKRGRWANWSGVRATTQPKEVTQ